MLSVGSVLGVVGGAVVGVGAGLVALMLTTGPAGRTDDVGPGGVRTPIVAQPAAATGAASPAPASAPAAPPTATAQGNH
jgi:hypothetical protein